MFHLPKSQTDALTPSSPLEISSGGSEAASCALKSSYTRSALIVDASVVVRPFGSEAASCARDYHPEVKHVPAVVSIATRLCLRVQLSRRPLNMLSILRLALSHVSG